jgi:hypothetical protein
VLVLSCGTNYFYCRPKWRRRSLRREASTKPSEILWDELLLLPAKVEAEKPE